VLVLRLLLLICLAPAVKASNTEYALWQTGMRHPVHLGLYPFWIVHVSSMKTILCFVKAPAVNPTGAALGSFPTKKLAGV